MMLQLCLTTGCVRIGYDPLALERGTRDAAPEDSGADAQPEAWPAIHPLGLSVVAGTSHTCALRNGVLSCWGSNDSGQLGIGVTGSNELTPVSVEGSNWASVQVGDTSTCGLRTDGHVLCWGGNKNGQLGQGDLLDRTALSIVPLIGPALALSLFSDTACAILQNHALYCWGNNYEGQLGLNDTVNAPPEPSPIQVGVNQDWQSISAGEGHTCGVRAPGTLWCWGRNTNGQLGLGTTTPIQTRTPAQISSSQDWISVKAGSFITCALHSTGTASCWGRNTEGAAVPGMSDPQLSPDAALAGPGEFVAIDTSIFHSCGLDQNDNAWCWGRNAEGQLGTGNYSPSQPETMLGNQRWMSIAVGRFYTCLMALDDSVWCTGANDTGTLGLGDTARRDILSQVAF